MATTFEVILPFDTPAMAESMRSSSFDPARLKRGKLTAYIVLPPEHMKAQAGWLRLIVGSMIRAVVREGADESRVVDFVLDESAALGQMDSIEALVSEYRKYGCRAQFFDFRTETRQRLAAPAEFSV